MVRLMDHPVEAPVWPAGSSTPPLFRGDRVHLVGIGGAGMSGLARVLVAKGISVSGTDRTPSPTTEDLEALGISFTPEHRADAIPANTKLLVYTPAVPRDNPELVAAEARNIPITKRFDLLAPLIDAADTVAIAGTHGKTTTSGLVAWVLAVAGRDPGYYIGGEVLNLGANAAAGAGRCLVIEADEYDRSFLHGHPLFSVMTNVEHDHPDLYPRFEDVVEAFSAFAARVRPGGRLIACAQSPGAVQAARDTNGAVDWYYVKTSPDDPQSTLPAPDLSSAKLNAADLWWADDVCLSPDGTTFAAWHQPSSSGSATKLGEFTLAIPGIHNVSNATAAIAVAERLGVPRAATQQALASYRGADRRFQKLGTWQGVTVIDDYAHHPTEIRASLAATRARFPGQEIWVAIEPHTYSRVVALESGFVDAASSADRVYFAPIYAAREAPVSGLTAARLASALPGAKSADTLPELVEVMIADLGALPGAPSSSPAATGSPRVVLFLGAGDITKASAEFMARLESAAIASLQAEANRRGLKATIQPRQPLADFTSLRVGGPAAVVTVRSVDELAGWWRLARQNGVDCRVIGRGSNVLVSDRGLPGLVIVNRAEAWSIETATEADATHADRALVLAESGVTLASLAQSLAKDGWCGFEAGVGIPGSVGAGVVTNAGAHGWEMADSVVWAEVTDGAGRVIRMTPADLGFAYRSSALKGDVDHVVTRVALKAKRDDQAAIVARIREVQAKRRASQPNTPSVGSMFKNPPGDFAGRLIEAAGLKGTRCGAAEISTKHANFFVNHGGARAADVAALINVARRQVAADSDIALHLEIEPMGRIDGLLEDSLAH